MAFTTENDSGDSISTTNDTATVTMGSAITMEASQSVLTNDQNVNSSPLVVSAVDGFIGSVVPLNGQSQTVAGQYGSLTMNPNGQYSYQPDEQYFSSVSTLVDRFYYVVQNNASDSAQGTLEISLLPNLNAVSVESMATRFTLNDELAVEGGVVKTESDGTTTTTLGTLVVKSFNEIIPSAEIQQLNFSISSVTQSIDVASRVGLFSNLPSMICTESPKRQGDDTVWVREFTLDFRSIEKFQFLSPNDQITFDYTIQFGQSEFTNAQTFSITIQGDNEVPVAVADSNFVYAGRAVSITNSSKGVLGNDSDIDLGDQMHVSAISVDLGDPATTTVTFPDDSPSTGVVSIEGQYGHLIIYADGGYSYNADKPAALSILPDSTAVGPTIETFTYTAQDRFGGMASQTLKIQVLGPQDKPMAIDDEITVDLNFSNLSESVFNIFANDEDVDLQRLTLAGTTNLPSAYLQVLQNGDIYLRAEALQALRDDEALNLTFQYIANNGYGDSNPAEVSVRIMGRNEAPHAHNDFYFYENVDGSTFEVGRSEGVILHMGVSDKMADSDIDGDLLRVSAVSLDGTQWWSLDLESTAVPDGDWPALLTTTLSLPDGVNVMIRSDGSFTLDAQDGYTGSVMFYYKLSDGSVESEGSVNIEIGGPAPLKGLLLINEISLQNGSVIRTAYTDNGAAPNKIAVGAASIELLNKSDEVISGSVLSSMMLEIVAPDGTVRSVSLGELTGLTQDASGHALNRLSIPAGGILMIYEPGSLGLGTWAVYGPNKHFVRGASGSYQGEDWHLGASTGDAIAINLTQKGTSIDFFAANGADTSELTGIIALGERDQGEYALPGVPWAGVDVGTPSGTQYHGSTSSARDTVFGRTTFTDTDSEQDWAHYVFAARTIGSTNTKLYRGVPKFVANPEDLSENLNPGQGLSFSTGQIKQAGSGNLIGGAGHDVLVGQEGSDILSGDELDDWLQGGGGNDTLDGGSGGDWLQGGAGIDQLRGGSGADVFVFAAFGDSGSASRDTILDFTSSDRLDLSAIDANDDEVGDQAFVWGGAVAKESPAAAAFGKVVYWSENGMTIVRANGAGPDHAPLELLLHGIHSLSAGDFTL